MSEDEEGEVAATLVPAGVGTKGRSGPTLREREVSLECSREGRGRMGEVRVGSSS